MAVFQKKRKRAFTTKVNSPKGLDFKDSKDLVKFSLLNPNQNMPLLVEPAFPGVDLTQWVRQNWSFMEEKLYQHAALLFRGFGLRGDEDFVSFLHAQENDLLPYFEGSTPRKQVGERVYTSTEYPSAEPIALHSEYSSSMSFPLKVWFFCTTPPEQEGETPIGDAHRILLRIDPEVRQKFYRLGWMLIRNYGDGLGLPWRRAFAIDDPDQLKLYCKNHNIELEFKDAKRLRTRQVRSAIVTHPVTGTDVWFNHMAFWHTANLRPEVRAEMTEDVGEDGLPFQTYYGDGSTIPDDIANHIRDCYLQEKIKYPYQKGDLMVIDNLLSVHGREAFHCARKIRVAMMQRYTRPDFSPELTS